MTKSHRMEREFVTAYHGRDLYLKGKINVKVNRKIVLISTIILAMILLIYIGYPRIIAIYLQHKWKVDLEDAASIGIIGGADGPTSILISSNSNSFVTIILALLVLSGSIYLIKTRKK